MAAGLLAAGLVACGTADPALPGNADPERVRLLGALPPSEAARGVYLVDLDAAGELSPGSRVAPLLGPAGGEARWLVETTPPVIAILGGVPEHVAEPDQARRVDDVVILAAADTAEAVVARLEAGARPEGDLVTLAATDVPVAWAGPTPHGAADGPASVLLSQERVVIRASFEGPAQAVVSHAERELAEGSPPGSPGKRWRTVLADVEVAAAGGELSVTAAPVRLDGLFLRTLLDRREMTFLPG